MKLLIRLLIGAVAAVGLLLLGRGAWSQLNSTTPAAPSPAAVVQAIDSAASPTAAPSATATTPPLATATATATPLPTATLTPLPTATPVNDVHVVSSGDTLGGIASAYGMTMEELTALNGLQPDDWLSAGEALYVNSRITRQLPAVTLIVDSQVVNGIEYLDFDLEGYIERSGGYLSQYDEWGSSGADVLDRMSSRYNVGPRVLLTALELLSGWVIGEANSPHPFGYADDGPPNLDWQAERAARRLMEGYYGQLDGRRDWVGLQDGSRARMAPGTNPGTAAVLNLLADALPPDEFETVITSGRFQATYDRLFGEMTGGPVVPPMRRQPTLTLPFKEQSLWYFTGGPHGAYGDRTSGWAAIDFAPPVAAGCYVSPYAVRSVSAALIVSIEEGEMWLDMDGDGDLRTGWVLFYMHLYTDDVVAEGQMVEAGDIIGYPSCLGGVASGAHMHIARMFDGQWMPAAGDIPFTMDGWQAEPGTIGASYNGYFVKQSNGHTLEACDCRVARKNRFPERPRVGGP